VLERVGHWENGKMEDRASFAPPDGSVYEGTWRADKRDGIGWQKWPADQDDTRWHYVGEWAHDQRHGLGMMFDDDGSLFCGRWENNFIVETRPIPTKLWEEVLPAQIELPVGT
jgi:hypothetical protein